MEISPRLPSSSFHIFLKQTFLYVCLREAEKKFLMAVPLREGGGEGFIEKKNNFLGDLFSSNLLKSSDCHKARGGGEGGS